MSDKRIEDKIKKVAEKIPVPDSLQPEQMEKKLESAQQKKHVLPFHMQRGWQRRLTAGVAAACLVLVAGTVWFVAGGGQYSQREMVKPEIGTAQEETKGEHLTGTTYEELCDSINSYNDKYMYAVEDAVMEKEISEDIAVTEDFAVTSSGSNEAMRDTETKKTNDFSDTDTQVKGIMEGDIVKTDGTHIFVTENVVSGSRIRIYKADEKEVTLLSRLTVENQDVQEMYLEGEKLLLITQCWNTEKKETKGKVQMILYNISDASHPEKITSHSQSGTYNTSRMRDGYLYTFTDYYVTGVKHDSEEPETFIPKADGSIMKEENIQTVTDEDSNRYMVMTSLQIANPDSFVDTFSSFGGSNVYYMNDNHIYATQPVYGDGSGGECRTQITRLGYDNGVFSKGEAAQVRGTIENSYYMHEYNGYFCFVYTRYRSNGSVNGLCVMDDKMKVVGELSGLGKDETIYSSYFMDNMAYFVTYRNTDPVFAVDLSNPKKPELKSELKLPGFSDYLHSFGDGQLVGIGKGDGKNKFDSVKLSLFEYDSKHRLKESGTLLIHQYTDSIAGSNHKAVFVDEERGLVGLGIENYNSGADSYQLYRYNKGKWTRLIKQKNISSIQNVRGVRIGNYFYVVDVEDGIRVYSL